MWADNRRASFTLAVPLLPSSGQASATNQLFFDYLDVVIEAVVQYESITSCIKSNRRTLG